MKWTKYGLCVIFLCAFGCSDDPKSNNTSNNTPGTDMKSDQTHHHDMKTSADMGKDLGQDMQMDQGKDQSSSDMGVDLGPDLASDMGKDLGQDMQMDQGKDMAIVAMNGGETCADALDVTAGGVWDNQVTLGARDDYDASFRGDNCPNARVSGPDLVYVVRPLMDKTYKILVEPTQGFDPMIYVRQDCASDACVDGTVLNGESVQESLTLKALANETYFIIVDGEQLSSGSFKLTIEAAN